jgi:hypothetical protein
MLLLSTNEVKDITQLPAATLGDWVVRGYVKPCRRGYRGQGCSDQYTPRQAFALCGAAAVRQVAGSAGEFVKTHFRPINNTYDEAEEQEYLDWLLGTPSQHTEERLADLKARGLGLVLPDGPFKDALVPMLARLVETVRRKHGGGAGARPFPTVKTRKVTRTKR